MNKNIPTVVITKMSPLWYYFQIYILGLYELERLGEIKLRFRCDWFYRITTTAISRLPYITAAMHKLAWRYIPKSYIMEGYVDQNGKRSFFCIDIADSPYIFDGETLKKVDVYFKAQCPKEINPQTGFRLTDDVYIPYCDHRANNNGERIPLTNLKENLYKIYPCVIGFRRLSKDNNYKSLHAGWESYRKGAYSQARKKVMCYFGDATGPAVSNRNIYDVDDEGSLLKYHPSLNHPNEKRAKVAAIIQSLGNQYDARIINEGRYGERSSYHPELVIPINQFCAHISNFQYNYNVSGFRMSIPNRFMESLIVGTAIITDKLAVKWYLPFEDEVIETVEMGYLNFDKIDWRKVENDILELPEVSKDAILAKYETKWAPTPVARYMVQTVISAK